LLKQLKLKPESHLIPPLPQPGIKMGYQAKSNMIPFRDTDNKAVAYGENPTTSGPSLDSDAELLNPPQGLDEDAMQRFTATGRPAPKFKAHGLISLSGDTYVYFYKAPISSFRCLGL
jgi:hypothetical protein